MGPDLTSIGAIRSPHDLLEAIVLPSESFVPGHEVYRVQTATETYSGVLGKSSSEAIRLITGTTDESPGRTNAASPARRWYSVAASEY